MGGVTSLPTLSWLKSQISCMTSEFVTVLCYHCTLVLTLIFFFIFAELIIPPRFIVSPAGSFPSYFLPSACSSLHLQEKGSC